MPGTFDKNKCDPALGEKVYQHLVANGMMSSEKANSMTNGEKKDVIQAHFAKILETLGMNLEDGNLIDTPRRLAKLWVNELFWGLSTETFPKVTTIDATDMGNYDSFVLEKNVTGYGCCSHHFLPMFSIKNGVIGGGFHVAYIPKKKIIGLSKLNRIVQWCCARPGTEEQYCKMIALVIGYVLECDSVAVMADLNHTCVSLRGASDSTSSTVCFYSTGNFQTDHNLRREFFAQVLAK
jgi:GTP cyclohydrolase I